MLPTRVAFRIVKRSTEIDRRRNRMPKFIVVIRFDGREISRRGFVHEDAAKDHARAFKRLGEIEPDGPQFEAVVYSL